MSRGSSASDLGRKITDEGHNDPSLFTCPACASSFVTKLSLARHMTYHENDPTYTCSFCQGIFFKKDTLSEHISSKHGGAKFSCDICGRNFSRRDHLLQHHQNVHTEVTTIAQTSVFKMETQTSSSMEDDSDSYDEFEEDYNDAENPSSMLEITVGAADRSHENITREFDLCSPVAGLSPLIPLTLGAKKLQCPQCPAAFTNQYNLDRHAVSHSSNRPYICNLCPGSKGFLRKEHLTKHKSSVHSGLKFTCEHCGKDISRKDHLIRHIKNVHPTEYLGIPPEVAAMGNFDLSTLNSSGFVFSQKTLQSLQPKPKKPYTSCDMCQEKFECLNELYIHQRTDHSEARKHTCEFCPKSFKRREHLQKHIVLHTGERNFSCELCGKEFPRKDALQDHIRRIHGQEQEPLPNILQIPCKYCEKIFSTKGSVRLHVQAVHRTRTTANHTNTFDFGRNGLGAFDGNGSVLTATSSSLPPVPALLRIGFDMANIELPATRRATLGNNVGLFDTSETLGFTCAHCKMSFWDVREFKAHLKSHRAKN